MKILKRRPAFVGLRQVVVKGQSGKTTGMVETFGLTLMLLIGLGKGNDDAGFFGKSTDGFCERDFLKLHHEREDVAAPPAPETMVDLFLRADGERRGFLLVKRAESGKALSPLFQAHVLGNDIDDVNRRADFFNFLGGNSHFRV